MTTEGTVQSRLPMSEHPDTAELRDRLARVSETTQARTVEGLAMLAVLYTAVSPLIIGSHTGNTSLTVSNLVVGLTATLLALDLGSAYSRAHGMSWVLPILGVWVIIAQWVMVGTTVDAGIMISNIIAGAVIVVLGAAVLTMPHMGMSRSEMSRH